MAAKKALPDHHHVMRYASLARRFVDPDTAEPLGPSLAAFAMRETDEGGMSVTEVEHFGNFCAQSRSAAAAAHRASMSSKKLSAKAIFVWAKVADVVAAGKAFDKVIRVVHAPVEGNPAHAEIRRLYPDDLSILEHLATSVFVEYEVVADMAIPATN